MSHFGVALEYALHVMTQLSRLALERPPTARALAVFQGVPPAYLAKIMTRLEKAGLVVATEGKGGGYRLGRAAEEISFLDVADAVEGRKPLFECTEVRRRCVLYGGRAAEGAQHRHLRHSCRDAGGREANARAAGCDKLGGYRTPAHRADSRRTHSEGTAVVCHAGSGAG